MVNVEYRLAPEYKYPACVQDAMCATTWVLKNKIKIGKQVLIIGVPHYIMFSLKHRILGCDVSFELLRRKNRFEISVNISGRYPLLLKLESLDQGLL